MAETLMLGGVNNVAAPTGSPDPAVAWRLSESYGTPVDGAYVPLLVESTNLAPAGPVGRTIFRRIMVPFRYAGSVTLRVTPIVDLEKVQPSVSRTYTAPETPTQDVMEVALAVTGTYLRVRVEVLDRSGLVEVYTPTVAHRPLGSAATGVVGPQSV